MGDYDNDALVPKTCGVATAFSQDMVVEIMLELNAMGRLGHSVVSEKINTNWVPMLSINQLERSVFIMAATKFK